MRLTRVGVAAVLAAALAPSAQAAELIVNGSFELPALPRVFNESLITPSILGWTGDGPGLEIGYAPTYFIAGYDGEQIAELDSNGNYTLSQTISGLTPGEYTLRFLSALRGDTPGPASGTFDVLWNGSLVQSFSPTSSVMSETVIVLPAIAGDNVLSFVGTGTSDGSGPIIDRVSLQSNAPEPGTLALVLGALPLVGRIARRRK